MLLFLHTSSVIPIGSEVPIGMTASPQGEALIAVNYNLSSCTFHMLFIVPTAGYKVKESHLLWIFPCQPIANCEKSPYNEITNIRKGAPL
jgi:hypothetical protein